jgi:hypothetical protein
MLELHVTLEVIVTSVMFATDVARKRHNHMSLFVTLQVVLSGVGLRTRGGSALFELVTYPFERTRKGKNNGKADC